jgi:hypothetical protein
MTKTENLLSSEVYELVTQPQFNALRLCLRLDGLESKNLATVGLAANGESGRAELERDS